MPYQPYLYLLVAKENIQEVTAFLSKKFSQYITNISQVENQSTLAKILTWLILRCTKRIWIFTTTWLV